MSDLKQELVLEQLEAVKSKYHALEEALADPKILSDGYRRKTVAKERADLAEIVGSYDQYSQVLEDIRSSEEILNDPKSDVEFQKLAS